MKRSVKLISSLFLALIIGGQNLYAQSKLNITSTLPNEIHLCAESASFKIRVRNISTGTVTGNSVKVVLPNGMEYEKNSVKGVGISEKNISNLQSPEFDLSDIKITESAVFTIQIKAACKMITFLNKGGVPKANITANYTGGSANHISLPFNIKQASLSIVSVSNQFITASKGDTVFRKIILKNSGDGHLPIAKFYQTNANGLRVIGVSGGNLKYNSDTIFSTFDSSYFKSIGNKDRFWSKNEEITIYDTLQLINCSKFQSKFTLLLDCYGTPCTQTVANANITLNNISPKLKISPFKNNKSCYDVSSNHEQGLVIINTGNDTARNPMVSAFQSNGKGFYNAIFSKIDTSSITIQNGVLGVKSKYITNSVLENRTTGLLACFGTKTVGGFDAFLPHIAPGDTLILRWNSQTCCTNSCGVAYYSFRWKFSAIYRDQCDVNLTHPETWGSGGVYTGIRMGVFMPTDVRVGDTSKLNLTITSGYLYGVTSKAKTTITFLMPKGVNHSLKKEDFKFEHFNGSKWEPNRIIKSGDTLKAVFIGTPKVTFVRSELNIRIFGDCFSSSANKNSNYSISIDFVPDTSCNNYCIKKLYCYTGSLRTHCNQNCAGGMKFSAFDADRITYGLPDNDNNGLPDASGTLNKDKIRLERIMYGDTLLTKFRGKINRRGTTTTWTRMTASSTISYGRFMSVADARIKIYRAGNLLYSCPKLASTNTTSGNARTFYFDLGTPALIRASCPLYTGFQFFANDSIELEVKYIVSTNPGNFLAENLISNEFYLHNVASPNASQKYQCDTFSGKFMLMGYYYTNYGRNTLSGNSCNEITFSQNYYLSIGNCCANYGGGNIFPYEYRSWAKPSKIFVIPPKGYDFEHAHWTDWRTAGTGKTQSQIKDSLKPSNPSADTLKFDIGPYFKDQSGQFELSDDGFHGRINVKVKPNCEAESSGIMKYGFVFEKKNYFGSGLDTVYTTVHNDIINYNKPKLKITALSNDVSSNSDTVEWQIRLENTSNISVAENTWFAATNNNNTSLIQVLDLDNKTAQIQQNDFFKLGSISSNESKNYLIRAVYKNCNRDSFNLLLGYNCRSYPDSVASSQCNPESFQLKYEPLNTRLESTITPIDTAIDLCKDIVQTVSISNKGNSKAFDIYYDLFLRSGMSLNDTAWLFLPNSSDSFPITKPIDLGQNTYRWNISNQNKFLDSNGLESVTSSKVNSLQLKYSIYTDCEFTSSIYYLARPGGFLKCGDEVNSAYSFSKPINVKGVKKPYFSDTKLQMGELDICKYNGKGTIRFLNLGPDTTGNQDFIQLTLPKGLYLDTNYLKGSSNVPPSKPSFSNQVGQWTIPSGIQPGDSMFFEFNTYENGFELDCGNTQIILNSVVTQPALCVSENRYCDIKVSTSGDLKLDSIKKADFILNHVSSTAIDKGQLELVSLNYEVSNTGTTKDSGVLLVVKIFDDVNLNGIKDNGESLIYSDSIIKEVSNSFTQRNLQFLSKPISSCRLLLVIDSTNCVCSPNSLSIPPISVKNAGKDTTACSRIDIPIGSKPDPSFSYKWSPSLRILEPDSSYTVFNSVNTSSSDATFPLILQTDKGACKTQDTVVITLHPALFLDLKSEEHICEGERIIVGKLPSGGTGMKTYQWSPSDSLDFDNKVLTWANPIKTTTYSIVIKDDLLCEIRDSTTVYVHPKPEANFSFKDTCEDELYFFKNLSLKKDIGIDSVHWQIGNEESLFWEPIILIDSSYQIPVQLYVQDSFGCWDTITKTIHSYPRPNASFSFTDGCQNDSLNFKNNSTIKSGNFSSSWLSENKEFYSKDLNTNFNNYGTQTIKLKVKSDRGCTDSISESIEIFEKPDVEIILDSVCEKQATTLRFIDKFNTNDSIVKYAWTFGDGQISSSKNQIHKYQKHGSYRVKLVVESNHSCIDSASSLALVYQKPTAKFEVQKACLGDTTIVINKSIEDQFNIKSIKWDMGVGYTQGVDTQKIKFNNIGLHPIGLVIETDHNCSDTLTQEALVLHKENLTITKTGNCENELISFNYTPQFSDSIKKITWNHNSNIIGSNEQLSKYFGSTNQQTLQLEVELNNSCISKKDFDFSLDPKPQSLFAYSQPCSDNYVDFTSLSSTPLGTINSENWDFGDGNTSIEKNPNHNYSLGSYTVKLISTNSFFCSDTSDQIIDIDNIVVPDFEAQDICANDLQTIVDKTTGNSIPIASYSFDMGDGTKINQSSFDYAYAKGGLYNIELTIETAANCIYKQNKQITVFDAPTPGFVLNKQSLNLIDNKVVLEDVSSGGTQYEYTISDGSFYSSANFEHEFEDTGTYLITQKVLDDFGCFAIYEQKIPVYMITNILVPNAFRPNKDGINETFGPEGLGIESYEIFIYDRWGGKIYESLNSKSWSGDDYPPGIYVYRIRIKDFEGRLKEVSGTIHLLR